MICRWAVIPFPTVSWLDIFGRNLQLTYSKSRNCYCFGQSLYCLVMLTYATDKLISWRSRLSHSNVGILFQRFTNDGGNNTRSYVFTNNFSKFLEFHRFCSVFFWRPVAAHFLRIPQFPISVFVWMRLGQLRFQCVSKFEVHCNCCTPL